MCSSSSCDRWWVIPKVGLCAAIDSLPDSLSHHFANILITSIEKLITLCQMLREVCRKECQWNDWEFYKGQSWTV